MNYLHKAFFKVACILSFAFCIGQSNSGLHAQPFKQEIVQFQKSDSIVMPPKGQIVFAGSSSFTKWKDVAMYFPGYPIINRGFGGATLVDLIYYVDEAIIKYQPKKVFIYCGENDIADVEWKKGYFCNNSYDKLTKDLNVTFKNGGNYTYKSVLETDYFRFETAESQGKVLNTNLKNYPTLKHESVDVNTLIDRIKNLKNKELDAILITIEEKTILFTNDLHSTNKKDCRHYSKTS